MASFADLIERLMLEKSMASNPEDLRDSEQEAEDTALMGQEADGGIPQGDKQSEEIIRSGNQINPTFWQDFIKIANNAEGLANLLGVSSEKVAQWGELIESKLKEIQSSDTTNPSEPERKSVINTGNNIGGEEQ